MSPSDDPADSSYQINQASISVGAGQKTGRGDDSTQTRQGFLPERHTDFIFAAVGERFGFVGAAFVLSLYALLIWRALRIMTLSKNFYGSMIAGGIAAMLLFQVFVNVGMNLGIMPITGIPLPLMSFGGSSALVTFLALGLLQSIHVQARLSSERGSIAEVIRVRRLPVSVTRELNPRGEILKKRILGFGRRRRDPRRRTRSESRGGDGGRNGSDGREGSGWQVGELYIERRGSRSIVGNIYKGVVDNVLPGMEAAFVDIGLERNGFLHVDEIVMPRRREAPRRGHGRGRRIDELIKPKQEVLVQVVKDPLKTKGARLSMQLSIAGRYLVYMPRAPASAPSAGCPTRSATASASCCRSCTRVERHGRRHRPHGRAGRREGGLRARPRLPAQAARGARAPLGGGEGAGPGLPGGRPLDPRPARRLSSRSSSAAIIDDEKQHDRVTSFFQRTAPELVDKSSSSTRTSSRCSSARASTRRFESTLSRRVDLPSGGYLIIDYAEALTVIDINTGSFTGRGKGRLEDTITKVNIEAADEVVRQLRLRDIGGIIVIDFIDMAKARNRDQVLKTLKKALDEDKTKTYVVEVSPLGLVEMTRQNVTDGVREILTKRCPTCDGEGVFASEETVAIEVLRKLRELAAEEAEARRS